MTLALSRLLTGVFLLAALVSPSFAQPPNQWAPPPPNLPQPTAQTQATSNVLAVPSYQPVPVVNPSGYTPIYPPGNYPPYNPYGGYLQGKADVINARANAQVTYQQAMLTNQQVGAQSLQYRRSLLDEAAYERSITPTADDTRLRKQREAISRARHDPPVYEIWNGDALNALLIDTQNALKYGVLGPPVPLSADTLKHINLTSGVTNAGLGLLKDGPKLRWPRALMDAAFAEDRKQIEQNLAKALAQAKTGSVDLQLVGDVRDQIFNMGDKLKNRVQEVPAGQYIDGKKFLSELTASTGTLKDPNVTKYLSGQWAAQASTVGELVQEMTAKGLKFAPAVSGDEPYYTALHQSLLNYDVQLTSTASR
jgi:hypothetical protein